jgi:hypothetical protein
MTGIPPSPQAPTAPATAPKAMTAADAAKRVKRPVVDGYRDAVDDAGNKVKVPVTKLVAVRADEVLSFKDYGTHVVVVTEDGQKFSSADLPKGDKSDKGE